MKTELIAIANERDYRAARSLVSTLMASRKASDVIRLRAQASLIEAYENECAPVRAVDPVEAIKFRMEQMGLAPADLVPIIGSRSKVSEVLNRKRRLSLGMIRRLHRELDIPAESLIKAA
jgi:HTH-type transcriptional regulator/antitoxin HigA